VQYSFDRMMGTGNGFTEPHPFWAGQFSNVEKVVATDKYTVEFQLKNPGVMSIYQVMTPEVFNTMVIVPREWVEQGDTQNWENQVGSGPWMVSDFQENVSITYSRNPDYWRYDERHPEYQLPYADSINIIAITDTTTALAALKTRQIDMITDTRAGAVSQAQAESLEKSNPEIIQYWYAGGGCSLDMRCDQEPFTDIRVRKALQMAVNRPLIAEGYFQGKVDGIPCGLLPRSFAQAGWTLPYEEWPEELQHEYSYDPEAARQLLADAGYPNGFDTAIIVDAADSFLPLVEIVKSQFADIGVNMEIDPMDTGTMRSVGNAGSYEGMALSGRMSFGLVPNIALGFRLTKSGNNWTRHSDTHFDDLVAAITTATTMEAAKKASTEADMYLISQNWGVYTLVSPSVTVFQPYLGGYNGEMFAPGSRNSFFPTRIWIKQAEKESL
jgi:peptide/nickel transport system substrate-binding protein